MKREEKGDTCCVWLSEQFNNVWGGLGFIGNEAGKLGAIHSGSALINDLEDFVAW